MRKILLFIVLISSFSFAVVYPTGELPNCSCGANYYKTSYSTVATGTMYIQSYSPPSECKYTSSSANGNINYYNALWSIQSTSNSTYWNNWKQPYACSKNPVCTAPQVLDETVNPPICRVPCDTNQTRNISTGVCEDNPAICPPGQHDDLSSTEIVHCVCDSGYPTYDVMTSGIKECVQPTCPPTSPDKSLPLKMENVDYATCAKLFSPILGFDFEFLPDPNSSLTCCWSDSAKAPDGNSSDGDCGLNRTLDNNGNCVDIPRVPHDCPAETFYSYSDDTCLPIYPDSNGTQGQGGSNDGVNSNGSIREDGDDTYYNGGGSESNESQKVLLEYNDDEATNMTEAFSNTVTKKFGDFLQKTGVDILKLYTISIPTMPSCGCENITYDFNLLNKQRSGMIDICSPMAQLFSILKPVLWFFFLIGMLFNFFMGRTN